MHKGAAPGSRSASSRSITGTPADNVEDGPIALLRAALAIGLQHKLRLALWVGLFIVLAAVYALSMSPTYTATATLLLEPRRQITGVLREGASAPTLDLNRADSELQVLRAERLLTQVFDSLDLENHPELKPSPPGVIGSLLARARGLLAEPLDPPGVTQEAAAALDPRASSVSSSSTGLTTAGKARQVAFANFVERLAARRVGQSYVVEISYSTSDAALAPRVVNAAVSAYLLQSIAFKADAARSGAEYVQGRVDALSAQVRAAAEAMRSGALPNSPTPDADARVIGAALQPLRPSAPRTGLIMALGGMLGFISAIVIPALGSILDRRVRTANQLTRETGIACLATVPEASDRNGSALRSAAEMDVLAVSHPESAFAAAVRDLRTSIKLAVSPEQIGGNHVIAFVSLAPNAGCSLLCMNLARLIQRGGKKVTVIDADLHGVERGLVGNDSLVGSTLVDALTKNDPVDQIVFLDLDGIAVLPARSLDTHSNYFVDLHDPKVAAILEFARSRGDVLLDLPPLSDSADARALAIQADAVVIVVTAGRSTIDEIKDAVRSLESLEANLIGAVINRAKAQRALAHSQAMSAIRRAVRGA